jgi:hypothetical protein
LSIAIPVIIAVAIEPTSPKLEAKYMDDISILKCFAIRFGIYIYITIKAEGGRSNIIDSIIFLL